MPAEKNFRLYLTLSQELLKFIGEADIDEFLDIERQRNELIQHMRNDPETETFRNTGTCRALVEKIRPLDMQIIYKARAWLNRSRRRNAVVRSYDLTQISAMPAGNILNRKY